MTIDDAFDELVSKLDYPMFIITTAAGNTTAGCLAGFVTQASIDPRRLLVMLSKQNHTYRLAQQAHSLVVHFLGVNNHDLATLFGSKTGDSTDKFAGCDWSAGPDGAPVISGTRGWVAGRIIERFDAGDHVAHLLETADAHTDTSAIALSFQAVRDIDPGHEA
jgi:flavin reductase (DIM6/NTAB) family NADH-FMN oxidoreductase RutF